jgi:UDP-3-O-[3-hydroxymyristoyl] glucosamine N-acyltransferase
MGYTLQYLAEILGGEASQIPGPEIEGARPLEFAQRTDITYVTGSRFLEKLETGSAGAVIVPEDVEGVSLPWIRVKNPEAAFARLTGLFYPYHTAAEGISDLADIDPNARIGKNVSIGAFCVVGEGAEIGDDTIIGSHVVVEPGVRIGAGARIFPRVTIYSGVSLGRKVIIHSGSVIGTDGFGYARDVGADGAPINVKKYHSGTVEIGDDVEIGALCAVDRALAGVTRIGNGVKVDNLVQIAHNVHIGDGTVIASQVGIAGSSSVGRYGMIGGQVGIRDHVSVGDGVMLAAQTKIYRKVPDGSIMAGAVPAMPHQLFKRVQSVLKRLPELLDRVRRLERVVEGKSKET